jgi:hypothetical protein
VDIGAFEFQLQDPDANPSALAPILSTGAFAPGGTPNFQFTFSDNTPGATFTVLATTNLSLPLSNWSVLGQPARIGPGFFQFTDLYLTNSPQRFYRVSSP